MYICKVMKRDLTQHNEGYNGQFRKDGRLISNCYNQKHAPSKQFIRRKIDLPDKIDNKPFSTEFKQFSITSHFDDVSKDLNGTK